MSEKTIIKEKVENEIKAPSMYRVVLLNDDYTTMDFVISVIVEVFNKSVSEATKIMFDIHEKGRGVVGVYTYDIARTKILTVERMARENEFPLKAILEEE